jgi:hypothetical protein
MNWKLLIIVGLVILVLSLLTKKENFVVNDPDRFINSLESPSNRVILANILDSKTLDEGLQNAWDLGLKDQMDYLVEAGTDPKGTVGLLLRTYLDLKDQLDDTEAVSNPENADYFKSLRNKIKRISNDLKRFLRVYVENRKRPDSKNKYRPLRRWELLYICSYLLDTSQPKLLEELVLADNIRSNKFRVGHQRRFPRLMNFLNKYWAKRDKLLEKNLDSLPFPTDIAKMIRQF